MGSDEVIAATECWIKNVVVGLNLCPFAAPVVNKKQVFYTVSNGKDEPALFRDTLEALDRFQQMDEQSAQTGFLIFSQGMRDFDEFNNFLNVVDYLLEESGLIGILQVVGFHPNYRFDGSTDNDPANYTNRSPFPMFHLILEDDLESAVASHPNPSSIPERNIKLLRELGEAEMARRLAACIRIASPQNKE
ncbi:MAG: DUF1415 domain-containing protein [Sedimenticola sp.]